MRVFTRRKVLLPLLAAVSALLIVAAVALANTTLTSHTGETGATWTQHSTSDGTAEIVSSTGWLRPSATATTPVYYASGAPANANYTVEADIKFLGSVSGHAGVVGRLNTGANTFYTCRYLSSLGEWQLYRFVAGTSAKLDSTAATLTVGTTYHAKLSMNGSAISCSVGGVTKGSATDANITAAGKAGLRFNGSSTVNDTNGPELDNFVATDL